MSEWNDALDAAARLFAKGYTVAEPPQCGNCKFWKRRTDNARNLGGGYCQRFPPSFQLDNTLNDAWPNTHQQEWCGEWQCGKNQMTT